MGHAPTGGLVQRRAREVLRIDPNLTQEEQITLLRTEIVRTGLSTVAYAKLVLLRDPRIVRRWLNGTSPIPLQVLRFLLTMRDTR